MKFKIGNLEYEVEAIAYGGTSDLMIKGKNGDTVKTIFVDPSSVIDLTKVEAQLKEKRRMDLEKEKSHFQTKLKEIESELKSLK